VNSETQTAENLYYRDINPQDATPARRDQTHGLTEDTPSPTANTTSTEREGEQGGRSGQPRYLFSTADELNKICEDTDLTIAQLVWENELAFRSSNEIKRSLMESKYSYNMPFAPLRLIIVWDTMDECIRNGVTSTETHLPGGLNVKRRAPHLYRRLQKGFYPTIEVGNHQERREGEAGEIMSSPTALAKNGGKRIGKRDHDLGVIPRRNTPVFPGIEYLSCMAIAVRPPSN